MFIFIYSEQFEFCDYGKLSSEKGNLLKMILGVDLSTEETVLKKKNFKKTRGVVISKLEEIIIYNKKYPMEYPSNIETFESSMFVEKFIFGEKLKLFQGGNELLIIALCNLLDLLDSAISNNDAFIRIYVFDSLIKHRNYLFDRGSV